MELVHKFKRKNTRLNEILNMLDKFGGTLTWFLFKSPYIHFESVEYSHLSMFLLLFNFFFINI